MKFPILLAASLLAVAAGHTPSTQNPDCVGETLTCANCDFSESNFNGWSKDNDPTYTGLVSSFQQTVGPTVYPVTGSNFAVLKTKSGKTSGRISKEFRNLEAGTVITLVAGYYRWLGDDDEETIKFDENWRDAVAADIVLTSPTGVVITADTLDFSLDVEIGSSTPSPLWTDWFTFTVYTSLTTESDITVEIKLRNNDHYNNVALLVDRLSVCQTKVDLCPRDCPKNLVPFSCVDTNECSLKPASELCKAHVTALTCDDTHKEFDVTGTCRNIEGGGGYECSFTQEVPACDYNKKDKEDDGNLVGSGVNAVGSVETTNRKLRGKGKQSSRKATEAMENQRKLEGFCAKGYIAQPDHASNTIRCVPATSSAVVAGKRRASLTCHSNNPYADCNDKDCDNYCPPGKHPSKCVCPFQYRPVKTNNAIVINNEEELKCHCVNTAKDYNNQCTDTSCPCAGDVTFGDTTCTGVDFVGAECYVTLNDYLDAAERAKGMHPPPQYNPQQCIMTKEYTCHLDCGVCSTPVTCPDCVFSPDDTYDCEDGLAPACPTCERNHDTHEWHHSNQPRRPRINFGGFGDFKK